MTLLTIEGVTLIVEHIVAYTDGGAAASTTSPRTQVWMAGGHVLFLDISARDLTRQLEALGNSGRLSSGRLPLGPR